jgi:hypothetical protein
MDDITDKPDLRTPADGEMAELLRELEESGGNIAAFARARGLVPWKLYKAKRGAEAGPKQKRSSRRSSLVPVRVITERKIEPLELVLASGHRLRIPAAFDESSLRRLMGVLATC